MVTIPDPKVNPLIQLPGISLITMQSEMGYGVRFALLRHISIGITFQHVSGGHIAFSIGVWHFEFTVTLTYWDANAYSGN